MTNDQDLQQPASDLRDVLVVGGGAAGLSAALMLSRARRHVTVIDAGAPRNAPAAGVHGLLGHEGTNPLELLARGREEVRSYGGEIRSGEVVEVHRSAAGFTVVLRDGDTLESRRLLIATGLVDELPDLPGVREQWGHGVLHCPYCHGWEVRDQRIGVLAGDPLSIHQAVLFSQWSPHVVFFPGDREIAPDDLDRLQALDVPVVPGAVSGLDVVDGEVAGVRLQSGQVVEVDAVVVAPRMIARVEAFAGIGIEASPHPMGSFIESDEFGRTGVPGVWVAGNAGNLAAQVGAAAAEGALAGAHINADLVMSDLEDALAERKAS